MPRIKNGVLVIDDFGDTCLFGEVYDDIRYKGDNGEHIKDGKPTGAFKNGNHILTSKVKSIEGNTITTRTGTVYEVVNLMGIEEMITHINEEYTGNKEYIDYLMTKIK